MLPVIEELDPLKHAAEERKKAEALIAEAERLRATAQSLHRKAESLRGDADRVQKRVRLKTKAR